MSVKSSLETQRFYRVKNPKKHFLCALCSAPRQLKYSKHLSYLNYAQIVILAAFSSWALFPIMGAKSFTLIFPIWLLMEIGNKILYRRDIPCPYCGFDATWYRRDVTVANKMVKDFWKSNHPELVNKAEDEETSEDSNGTEGPGDVPPQQEAAQQEAAI